MTEKIYLIRDNGLRCFVSPCFSWDIIDVNSQSVSTASTLDISKLSLDTEQANQVMTSLIKGEFNVNGYIVDYEVKNSEDLSPKKGIKFIVIQIIGRANP